MTATAVTAAELVATASVELEAAGVRTGRNDAEWLLAGVLGVGRFEPYLAGERVLTPPAVARYADLVRRRAAGEPLQQLLGWEAFRGLRVRVTPEVLVPRPETEVLVESALALLGADARLVVDVGTGSGCIACAIAIERPEVHVLAVDVSAPAALVASGNVAALGLARRVGVVTGDLLNAVRTASVDLIVGNPPYLPTRWRDAAPREVREWEPRVALDGGEDGLDVLRPLIADARRVLRAGGALALETAGPEQARGVGALLRLAGYRDVRVNADLTGTARLVSARWRDAAGRRRT